MANNNQIVKGDEKVIKAWIFYDWANSVFPLVITTAIFPIFYSFVTKDHFGSDKLTFLGMEFINTVLVSYVNASGFLIISFMSPLLSGIADYLGNKKRFLQFFCFLGGLSSIGLATFNPANLELGFLFFLLAMIGYWSSIVFYNAYLPEIAEKEDHDRISARGFSSGYIGASILLILCLVGIKGFGMPANYAFALTGVWWIGFSFITYRRLPNSTKPDLVPEGYFWTGFRELKLVWGEMRQTKRLKRFLISFFFFSMGVQTVMLMAPYFGEKKIDWPTPEEGSTGLIISILLIQFIAIGGAFLCSWGAKKIGNLKVLLIVLLIWCGICVSGLWVHTPLGFYIVAATVGLVMGGVQSLSRSTYSKFLPETKDTASYFSFFDVAEKIGICIGIFAYGFIEGVTGDMRMSMLALISFFVVGAIILVFVPKKEVEFEHTTNK